MTSPIMLISGKPLLIYDGDCGFCKRSVERWQKQTGDRVRYVPYQEVAHEFPDIPLSTFEASVHLVEGEHITCGAEAVFRTLRYGGMGWLLFLYQYFPGFVFVSEWVYRLVARHRSRVCVPPHQY